MKWVTRERPVIDRIACPWLIAKFIDKEAEFLFVPPADVVEVAEQTGATPYDVPGENSPMSEKDAPSTPSWRDTGSTAIPRSEQSLRSCAAPIPPSPI